VQVVLITEPQQPIDLALCRSLGLVRAPPAAAQAAQHCWELGMSTPPVENVDGLDALDIAQSPRGWRRTVPRCATSASSRPATFAQASARAPPSPWAPI
jgi:hypothetical protein